MVTTIDREIEAKDLIYDPTYYRYTRVADTGYFLVELLVAPYGKEVTVDFTTVELKTPSASLRPSRYYIVEPRYGAGRLTRLADHGLFPLCRAVREPSYSIINPIDSTPPSDVHQPVRLQSGLEHCFVIRFDVPPPHPTSSFAIEAPVLTVDGKPVALTLTYQPATIVVRLPH